VQQGARDCQPALHALGESAHHVMCPLAKSHQLQDLGDPSVGVRHAVKRCGKIEVLLGCHFVVERRLLGQDANAARRLAPALATSSPSTRTVPRVGRIRPQIMSINVVLPAPLGPTIPTTWPVRTFRERPSMAQILPKYTARQRLQPQMGFTCH